MLVLAAPARPADAADACAVAYEQAQEQRLEGELLGSRDRLLRCAAPACPAFIQRDCARWLGEVEAALPTIVILAHDAGGRDLTAVQVSSDGVLLTETLDGRPLTLNPGKHRLTFESVGLRPVPIELFLVQGQKNRVVEVVFSAAGTPVGTRSSGAFPRSVIAAGGLTLAGLLTFGSFAVAGQRAESADRQLPCAQTRTCSDAQLADARRYYLLADVGLVVGVVASAATAYLWFRSRGRVAAEHRQISLGAAPGAIFAAFSMAY